MKKLALLIISILFIQLSYSQENYLEGTIVTADGNSISGFIDYRNWDSNPTTIKFKSSIDGQTEKFTPGDLLQFSVTDEIYISAIVDLEITPIKTHLLTHMSKLILETDAVFLQAIVKGEKSLYYHKDKYGVENFYIYNNDAYQLLIYKKYFKEIDRKNVIVENNKFIGQLTIYLNNCASISPKIGNAKYNIYSLKRLFETYYKDCTETSISFQKETEKDLFEFGVLLGASQTSILFSGNKHDYLAKVDFPSSTNFTAGGFMELVFKRSFNRWSLNNEIIFTTFSTKGEFHDHFYDRYTDLKYSYLKLNNMLRYKYPIGKTFVYGNIGLSTGYVVQETNELFTVNNFSNTTKYEAANIHTRKMEFGLLIGLGTKWKRFSMEVRYERGNGMSNLLALSSPTRRYYLFLGYRF